MPGSCRPCPGRPAGGRGRGRGGRGARAAGREDAGTRCDRHLPQPVGDAGTTVALLSSRPHGPRPATPGSPRAVGAIGARCARWPELSPPRRQRRPSIRAGTDATHASRPAPSPRRLLQGDTPGRWHARRRRRLRQGGDAGSGGTREPSPPQPGAAETDSHSRAARVLRKMRRAATCTPPEKKHIEHSLFSAHRNSRFRTQCSHAPPELLSFHFSTHCNSMDSTFLPSPSFGGKTISVFRLRGESVRGHQKHNYFVENQ